MDRCDGCGYEYDLDLAPEAAGQIADGADDIAAILREGGDELAARPEADTWSPLEYACHVRDVLLVQRERVLEARRVDRPTPTPMGRDERAVHDGYAEQDPEAVARQLGDAGLLFANVLDRLDAADWDRPIVYNYPTPTERTLRWVAVHTLHELRHHVADIEAQLD